LTEVDRRREDEWFRQNERNLLEAAREARLKRQAEREAEAHAAEGQRLKAQHFMKCPKCGHDLRAEVLEGITIDRCTFCEGYFLDAGEIEQLFLKRELPDRQGFMRRLLGI
jgi:ribosomal protein L32